MAGRPIQDGSGGLHSSRYWRDRAEEARSRASEMRDDYAKSTMLGLANMYDRMARRAADRESGSQRDKG